MTIFGAQRAYVAWGGDYIKPLVEAFRGAPKAEIIFVLEFLIIVAIAPEKRAENASNMCFDT